LEQGERWREAETEWFDFVLFSHVTLRRDLSYLNIMTTGKAKRTGPSTYIYKETF